MRAFSLPSKPWDGFSVDDFSEEGEFGGLTELIDGLGAGEDITVFAGGEIMRSCVNVESVFGVDGVGLLKAEVAIP